MRKNFLGVKGMTLMGDGGLEFKRFAANTATQAVPLLGGGGQSFRNMIQLMILTMRYGPEIQVQ